MIGKQNRDDVQAVRWLLEIRDWKDHPPTYLKKGWGDEPMRLDHMGRLVLDSRTTTTDPNHAEAFNFQTTAEAMAIALKGDRFVATEHMWMKP